MSRKNDKNSKRYQPADEAESKGMAKKHPPKPGLGKMFVPADLRALGITNMRDFVSS